ncbi:MAG: oligopeptide transporter, OPT family [Gammaproteobacteria bacterium]|jgi:putative OPT family oligopeptide transporter|nr:oligopeptide transporter, OPT family [Gammaproteobacteria bacterium]
MSAPLIPPQLTPKAIILGIILAMILAGANAYLGLFAGITVSASIPAAVISMGVLRLFRDSNILENNIVQTAASAGESVAAGAIFTLPALILLGYWEVFDYAWVCAIAGLGGLLGVLFTIPLRRSLIVEQKLPFPEGTATAEVLKVGDSPGRGLRILGLAALVGGVIKFAETGLRIWPATAQTGLISGGSVFYVGTNLSPALLSVGYIVGLNISVLIFVGGVISWFVAIPIYSALFMDPATVAETDSISLAYSIWSTRIRYLGVGAMLVGGIWALISIRGSVIAGLRSGLKQSTAGPAPHTDRDAPMRYVLTGIALLVVPIFLLYQSIVDSIGVGLAMTLIMVVAGFLFSAVAGYMAGLVGSSQNPVSGVTIATILFASLLLLWLSGASAAAAAAAIMIGAVVCCAAAIAGDNMQDLKAGYLLGATPWKQQLMQGIGVVSAVLVMAPVLNLLLVAYGIGPASDAQPNSLTAPQATLMASVADGVLGGELPWGLIAIGALIGAAIILVDLVLEARDSAVRAPVLAVAVGIYLPLELSVPILLGGIVAWLVQRQSQPKTGSGPGILFAAGLITGEALLGIVMAIPIVVSGNPSVLAAPETLQSGPITGLLILAGVIFTLWYTARQRTSEST